MSLARKLVEVVRGMTEREFCRKCKAWTRHWDEVQGPGGHAPASCMQCFPLHRVGNQLMHAQTGYRWEWPEA